MQIDPNQSPSASTAGAAVSVSATATAAATASSISSTSGSIASPSAGNGTVPASTIDKSSGLSTGAKAGIAVGVAVGACLLAAIAVAFLLRRKHQGQNQPQQPQQPQYPAGPQMQGGPYYSPQDKSGTAWQGAYPFPATGPHMPIPYYNPAHGSPYHDASAMYAADLDPRDGMPQKITPSSPPMELSGEQPVHEIGSEVSAVSPPTPTPAYADAVKATNRALD